MGRRSESVGIALLLILASLAAPVGAIVAAPLPERSDLVLVIGPDPGTIVEAAGGRHIGPYTAFWGALATGDATFAEDAMKSGAWRVIDAGWLSEVCGPGSIP